MATFDDIRERQRPYHACLNCRRKKARCPGERPQCSSCVRLKQGCSYMSTAKGSLSTRSTQNEHTASRGDKLEFALSGSSHDASEAYRPDETSNGLSEASQSTLSSRASGDVSSTRHPPLKPAAGSHTLRPPSKAIANGLNLYFEYCHRQPIWLFERREVEDHSRLPTELICSIIVLTSRFSRGRDQFTQYGDDAKAQIMTRIATGSVDLTTIECLCLLSYSAFIDGDVHLGRFHVGLAFQICRSAMLDLEPSYMPDDPDQERKKRLFWSLQILEQFYGRQAGFPSTPSEIWRPAFSTSREEDSTTGLKSPPLPMDPIGCADPNDLGIWSVNLHLGWVWQRVREYVSDCARNKLKEPWKHDSMYAIVFSDFLETENRIPICHRYDSVKFYERKMEDLRMNLEYWKPWLKDQFTYHAIHTVLNHPFLYIVASQYNSNLAIPNTFWRRSSELGLLHSTWIVRMVDMVMDKQIRLTEPFFGHAAAIAATVHLYYCCAADPRLRHKSNADFSKCRKFLKTFTQFSRHCEALDQALDKLARIAAGSNSPSSDDWIPSRIHLSVPLMWDILQFDCTPESQRGRSDGVLHPSLMPSIIRNDAEENSTLEIIVAISPEITVNTADGGQTAPASSYKAPARRSAPSRVSEQDEIPSDTWVAPIDNLMINTPWLWADPSQFVDIGDLSTLGDLDSMI